MKHIVKKISSIFIAALFVSSMPLSSVGAVNGYPEFGATFHGFWNYNNSDAERAEALQKLKATGAEWVRIDVGWATIESTEDVYAPWALQRYDAAINQAYEAGFDILLTVQNAPEWSSGSSNPKVPPTNPDDFGEFMKDMSNRYATQVDAMEIWNEPNHDDFFIPSSEANRAAEYFAMVQAAYSWIKDTPDGNPNMTVLAAGSVYVDDAWWRDLYELGIKDYTDVVAVNPYMAVMDESPLEPDNGTVWRMQHLPALIQVMEDFDDTDKPIWFTEFGWSTHEPYSPNNWERPVTPEQQALYLQQTMNLLRDEYPQVEKAFWYNLRSRTDANIHLNNFGLLNPDMSERPAYFMAQSLFTVDPQQPGGTGDGSGTTTDDDNRTGVVTTASAASVGTAGSSANGTLADTGDALTALFAAGASSLLAGLLIVRRLR